MDVLRWISDMDAQLEELRTKDLGYPIGHNLVIRPPDLALLPSFMSKTGLRSSQIIDFYNACAGVSLPDVHVGHFVHRLEIVLLNLERGPTTISGPRGGRILLFGADGGGNGFAMRLGGSNESLYLPHSTVRGSVYEEEPWAQIRMLSHDFDSFLLSMLADLESFVHAKQDWTYMI